jgi:xanthine dehydrogenase accessory factor
VRDEAVELLAWQRAGARFALATVVGTSSSAPRPAGAILAVHPDGRLVGTVSGGCVEPAVVAVAEDVLRTGVPQRVRYGYTDEDALAVGLTCGGEVELLVRVIEADDEQLTLLAEAFTRDEPAVLVTVVADASDVTQLGGSLVVTPEASASAVRRDRLSEALAIEARAALGAGITHLRHFGLDGERMGEGVSVLIESFAPRPRLVIVGALDFAAALSSVGRFLGFRVSICDARGRFATRLRFPEADEVIVDWPHRHLASAPLDARSAVCVLTHDPKFDVPALIAALASNAGYVGAMGSRRTHEDRLARLREAGVDDASLARLRSPIGLALGGRSPQETALAIAAEIVLLRNGGDAAPLRELDGPIHPAVRTAAETDRKG